MKPESLTILDGLVTASTMDLFAGYGVAVTYAGHTAATALPASATVAGMIGFSGDQIRGSMLLASSDAFFAGSTPAGATRTPGYERDWAAELSNQLLGRLKNRLYRYGVDFSTSTPTALSGAALAVASPATQHARGYAFHGNGAEVWIRIDFIDDAADLTKMRDDGAEAAREGDVLMF